jgi:hypothetical protein
VRSAHLTPMGGRLVRQAADPRAAPADSVPPGMGRAVTAITARPIARLIVAGGRWFVALRSALHRPRSEPCPLPRPCRWLPGALRCRFGHAHHGRHRSDEGAPREASGHRLGRDMLHPAGTATDRPVRRLLPAATAACGPGQVLHRGGTVTDRPGEVVRPVGTAADRPRKGPCPVGTAGYRPGRGLRCVGTVENQPERMLHPVGAARDPAWTACDLAGMAGGRPEKIVGAASAVRDSAGRAGGRAEKAGDRPGKAPCSVGTAEDRPGRVLCPVGTAGAIQWRGGAVHRMAPAGRGSRRAYSSR